MKHKSIWISFWMTVMYWLGGAFGCAAPEQVDPVDQLIEQLETIKKDQMASELGPDDSSVQDEDIHGGQRAHQETQWAPGEADRPVHETEPSLRGLDRSHWPTMTVGAADGATPHGSVFFEDLRITRRHRDGDELEQADPDMQLDLTVMKLPAEDFSRVHDNAIEVERQMIDSMKGNSAEGWSRSNSIHLLIQPVKVGLDLATLPFRHLKRPDQADGTPAEHGGPVVEP